MYTTQRLRRLVWGWHPRDLGWMRVLLRNACLWYPMLLPGSGIIGRHARLRSLELVLPSRTIGGRIWPLSMSHEMWWDVWTIVRDRRLSRSQVH
jgi:hypothetical protein